MIYKLIDIDKKITEPESKNIERFLRFLISKKTITILIIITIGLSLILGPWILFIIAPVYLSFVFGLKKEYEHRQFMIQYSKEKQMTYLDIVDLSQLKGRLFEVGDSKKAKQGIMGTYNNYPIKIFNYSYTIGSGKNQNAYFFTVCEIEIEKIDFPHIFLKSKSMWGTHFKKNYFGPNKDTRIKLEKQFEDKFNLYCTEDYEIEVLQIFTKDLLGFLVEHGNKFSIEFSENKIYIYDDKIIRNKKDLDELYSIVKIILDRSGDLIKRLADDFEAMHNSYRKI